MSVELHRSRVHDAVAATASATLAPTTSDEGFLTVGYTAVHTLVTYSGTVTACALTIWFRDQDTNIWYRGANTDDLDALDPGGASAVNEARTWGCGVLSEIFFQVSSIAGGGTAAVRVQGTTL